MGQSPMVTMYNAWDAFQALKAPWSFYERLRRDLDFAGFKQAFRFTVSTQTYPQRVLTNAVLPHLSAFAVEENIFVLKYLPQALYVCLRFSQMLVNEEAIVQPTPFDDVSIHSSWSMIVSLRIKEQRMRDQARANGMEDGDPARLLWTYFPSKSLVARSRAPSIHPHDSRIFRWEQKEIILDQFLAPESVVRPLVHFAEHSSNMLEKQFLTLPITGWGPSAFLAGATEAFYNALPRLQCQEALW